MRDKKITFFLLILINLNVFLAAGGMQAKDFIKRESLFKESEELIYSKPDDALKIAQHLLNGNISDVEKTRIHFLIAEIYKVKGDHNNVLNYLYLADENASGILPVDRIQILIEKSIVLRTLYLDKQARKYIELAKEEILQIKDQTVKDFLETSISLEQLALLLERQNYKEASGKLQKEEKSFESTLKNYPFLNLKYTIIKGRTSFGLGDFDKAKFYYNEVLHSLDKEKERNIFAEFYALTGLATIKFHEKVPEDGTRDLMKALEIANKLQNLYYIDTANKLLVANFIVLNDSANYKRYNHEFLKTQALLENADQESVNTAYNLIVKEQEEYYKSQLGGYFTKLYVVLSLFLVILMGCGFVWFKYYWKKKRLNEIISYLEVTRNNFIIRFTEKKDVGKKFFVPQETEQLLLSKLKRFENSTRFTNKDMSLAVLAGQFETNTKYLSEVINKHYNVNFNTYINKLRINFIVKKLKSDSNFINYKISYLAETCGFSSHSSFATVFKSITGIAPITFIELLKDEKEVANF
ncbi:helix-turn-helix domain-containing protein [Flavobacterium amniphilum]|uniref:helix-turn-helix domain-containing protein n=1 Tax=Flavobacterium amniphilum TaxID=1834035 RepID=UPI00202AB3EA|nr:helix-turn-helix domain-containing protein [Flavobacterium amniphilum]MCL9805796.1 helix-turn-helix domain-containing protein [Flavobacterium amniphilum]MCL9806383.1 helix-turn-helix domain-containing protein [Flavobacterium amniphilum]